MCGVEQQQGAAAAAECSPAVFGKLYLNIFFTFSYFFTKYFTLSQWPCITQGFSKKLKESDFNC
jgi:hypothetical protein